jgi:hypothetical protein
MSGKIETKKRATKKNTDGLVKSKSSYLHFCAEERENIKNDGKVLKNTEIITELGVRWNKLKESDPERLAKFEDLAKNDKERYLQDKQKLKTAAVVAPEPTVQDTQEPVAVKKPRAKASKKKAAPVVEENELVEEVIEVVVNEEPTKKKANPYIKFCKAKREEVKTGNPSLQPKEVISELGRLWKSLSDEEKLTFN